ncbi:extracellular solute-binding protein [Wukongibacter baidiensis]|uniref:extracellular solute-binding protein n=1 Tax=Wukongibacter baidiensis TaxID=1723361 RepID=UPI003D7F8DB4
MSKKIISLLLVLMMVSSLFVGCGSKSTNEQSAGSEVETNEQANEKEVVEIEYWQYFYETKIKLMDELIAEFEAKNPGIKVVHKHFPYDSYQQKVAAAIATNTGPDIINLYYGWVPKYVKSGVLQELPQDVFSHDMIENDFAKMVSINKIDNKYYTIPIAVRTLALFWNKDLVAKGGFDSENIPTDFDKLLDMAEKLTIRENGEYVQEGLTFHPEGQLHHVFRPLLLELFGQSPLSQDNRKVQWNGSENGYKAFEYLMDMATKRKVGEPDFMTDDVTAFLSGKAAFHIDGSYRLGTLAKKAEGLNWGVTEIPSLNGKQLTAGSFWTNGITKNATDKKLEASVKFLQYLSSAEVMKRWTEEIGEIGARVEFAENEELLSNKNIAPFIKQLPNSTAYFYVDESADRKALIDAIDRVLIEGMDPRESLDIAVEEVQKILDDYWNN